jgi:hypothetical protein
MVVFDKDEPEAETAGPGDVLDYAEAMGLQLALMCEAAGANKAAVRFREAAAAAAAFGSARQPPVAKAAPGDAA